MIFAWITSLIKKYIIVHTCTCISTSYKSVSAKCIIIRTCNNIHTWVEKLGLTMSRLRGINTRTLFGVGLTSIPQCRISPPRPYAPYMYIHVVQALLLVYMSMCVTLYISIIRSFVRTARSWQSFNNEIHFSMLSWTRSKQPLTSAFPRFTVKVQIVSNQVYCSLYHRGSRMFGVVPPTPHSWKPVL